MTKVLVAMSGGVDSSVAAFLLKERGFDVTGITFDFLSSRGVNTAGDYGGCLSRQTIQQAKQAAGQLNIKHLAVNLSEFFEKTVIENFYSEYKQARTPNPCIRCNQFVKFDALEKQAGIIGAEYICTGHYAVIQYNRIKKRYLLKTGRDKAKDQSYFLYVLKQDTLKHTLFPLGKLTKDEVRKIAKKAGLENYARRDSQELCFVEQKDYRSFINRFLKPETGDIVDTKGRVLGKHTGIFSYTIGQRKGLGLSGQRPYYVISIDWKRNKIVIGFEEDLYSKELFAADVNFISIDSLKAPLKVKAKIRYRQPQQPAVICEGPGGRVKVEFLKPQRAVTPGQAVVFYSRGVVVGGGTIVKIEG